MKFLWLSFGLVFWPPTFALAGEKINSSWFSNVAIDGYDVVAYHKQNIAIEGKKDFSAEFKGANWRFISAENLQEFLSEPDRYIPQYGGYCAFAVVNGTTADIDPKVFSIYNGKLYLNYNAKIGKTWEKNKDEFIKKADVNWPKIN